MPSQRDDFARPTVDALAKRSAFICSNPDCRALTVAPSDESEQKFIYIGKAAHICAAAEGGPRYDPSMSPGQRKSIENGIFLCSNCADMVDKNGGLDFSVETLHAWKRDHETWVRDNLNKGQSGPAQSPQVFNVSSTNQRGGITAGVVNMAPQPRKVDAKLRAQMKRLLPDKSKVVTVTSVMGDGEAFGFATDIKASLEQMGYTVKGVNQAVYTAPVMGQHFNPDKNELVVGTRE